MTDIKGFDNFVKVELITKGWSEDKKYFVETSDGQRILLRISDVSKLDLISAEYEMMKRVYEHGVLTPQPLDFGLCNGGKSVYSLSSWFDGEDVEKAFSHISEAEQYVYGLKASEMLQKIHSLPAPKNTPEWDERYFSVMDERLMLFSSSGITLENSENVFNYLKDNRYLLKDCPQGFRHGDYSIGNLMITNLRDIAVVDWEVDDFDNYGDPWLDFTDVVWSADKSPHFATGLIKGYFGNKPPIVFWELLMFYVFTSIISSILKVERTHKEAVGNEIRLYGEALNWFDNMNNPVPTWYLKDFNIQ